MLLIRLQHGQRRLAWRGSAVKHAQTDLKISMDALHPWGTPHHHDSDVRTEHRPFTIISVFRRALYLIIRFPANTLCAV
jgi:hypothetical protein